MKLGNWSTRRQLVVAVLAVMAKLLSCCRASSSSSLMPLSSEAVVPADPGDGASGGYCSCDAAETDGGTSPIVAVRTADETSPQGLAGLIGRTWEDLHELLLSFVEKGGDVWEIPPLPRLLLTLLLGQQPQQHQGDESDLAQRTDDGNGTGTAEGAAGPACMDSSGEQDIAPQFLGGNRLSFGHHIDVIRDRGNYLDAKKQRQKYEAQVKANAELLRRIGKRSADAPAYLYERRRGQHFEQ